MPASDRPSHAPRIAFLDTGGTLGASTAQVGARREIKTVPGDWFRDTLSANLDRHLEHFYAWNRRMRSSFTPFEWDYVHFENTRILSENSHPQHWRSIIQAISSYVDDPAGTRTSDDLIGIIVIHGTDTMAQVVPAIQWAVRDQQIPIVFVGSNYPMSVDNDQHLRLSRLGSDAWPNLLTAVGFCALAERVPPQILLSFGACVHQALNLRKINESAIATIQPASSVPSTLLRIGQVRSPAREPYIFHNVLSHTKYLARLVMGDFVFAASPFLAHKAPDPSKPAVEFDTNVYDSQPDLVAHLFASPLPAMVDEGAFGTYRVALIETYESGTIPWADDHRFYCVLRACAAHSMPVFLASHYGIDLYQLYDIAAVEELRLAVYRIDNIIPEAALPLLRLSTERVLSKQGNLHGVALGDAIRKEMQEMASTVRARTAQLDADTRILRVDEETTEEIDA